MTNLRFREHQETNSRAIDKLPKTCIPAGSCTNLSDDRRKGKRGPHT